MRLIKLIIAATLTGLFIVYGIEPFFKYVLFPFTLVIGVMFFISIVVGVLVLKQAFNQQNIKKP